MVVSRSRVRVVVMVSAAFMLLSLVSLAEAQGIQQTPFSAANEVRRVGPFSGSTPSNTLGMPGSAYSAPAGSDTILLSSGMLGPLLPRIANLEFGFLYDFGRTIRNGRFTADYVLPMNLGGDAVLFGEAHGEFQGFWKRPSGGSKNRTDLSFGGGYRRMFGDSLLFGANAFYDSSRLFSKWYSSGALGLEMAAIVGGDDAVDVNFNWYGNLFGRNGFVNAFRNQGGSFDLEAGYSHALFDHTFDLRLKVAAYQFDVGQKARGWRGGADLTTRDGRFTVRYEHGQDPINGSYNTVGGFVNVGFKVENILKGQCPFTKPEPVFQSPRNIRRMLTQKVKRNWHQPASVVVAREEGEEGSTLLAVFTISLRNWPLGGADLPTFDGGGSLTSAQMSTVKRVVVTITTDAMWNTNTIRGVLGENPIPGPTSVVVLQVNSAVPGTFTTTTYVNNVTSAVNGLVLFNSGAGAPAAGINYSAVVRFYQ